MLFWCARVKCDRPSSPSSFRQSRFGMRCVAARCHQRPETGGIYACLTPNAKCADRLHRQKSGHSAIARGHGYDHNWILNGTGYREVAILSEPNSGRRMRVLTDQPSLQVYTGNFLGDSINVDNRSGHSRRGGDALETQHFLNSPNQPTFPDTILRPGRTFRSRTVFAFETIDNVRRERTAYGGAVVSSTKCTEPS